MTLTPAQSAALDQLTAITASSTDAAKERDAHLLKENGYDVEATVNQIFSGGAGFSSSTSGAGPSSRKAQTEGSEAVESGFDGEDINLGPVPRGGRRIAGTPGRNRRRGGTTATGLSLWETLVWPFTIVASIMTGSWYWFLRTLVPLSVLPHLPRFLLPPPSRPPPHGPRDPTTTALRFVRDLETLTGNSVDEGTLPDFFIGGYRDFLSQVRKQGRVGVVVLVCSEHEDDYEFKRDVLADPEFIRTLKDHEIMVWAADISSREGFMVSQTLLITTYPAITFASLLPAQNSSVPQLTVLTTVAGSPSTTTSTSALIQTITNSILPRTNAYLGRLRRQRLQLEEARHLREEQDKALREAERKDRDRLQAARAQAELERVQRERAEREEARKAKALEDRRQWRRYARKHLLPPNGGPTRVAIRTPLNSERHIRNFTPSGSTLALFIYTETLLIPAEDDPVSDPDSPPEGYEHAWGFRLVTSFPRREIEMTEVGGEEVWAQVKSAGGALFAEKIESGDWGEAEIKSLRSADSEEEEIESD